jgi:hypothetical protein
MNRSLKMQLALGILSASWQAYAGPVVAPPLPLSIHLYDLVNISSHTLDEATREAARLLATADVEIVWQPGPANSAEAHASDQAARTPVWRRPLDTRDYMVVRIVQGFPAGALQGALGFSLPDAKAGAQATVFYDRIQPLGQSGVISVSALLGHAMAHEIGHVLLGTTEHSLEGIMKARWGRPDYLRAAMGFLEFTPSQRAAIRERLLTRLAKN